MLEVPSVSVTWAFWLLVRLVSAVADLWVHSRCFRFKTKSNVPSRISALTVHVLPPHSPISPSPPNSHLLSEDVLKLFPTMQNSIASRSIYCSRVSLMLGRVSLQARVLSWPPYSFAPRSLLPLSALSRNVSHAARCNSPHMLHDAALPTLRYQVVNNEAGRVEATGREEYT